ncbi:MAG: hotdog domain-containing protein, partial [Deltaproteobacteria bacterium]
TELLRKMDIIYAKMASNDFNLPLSKAFCHYLTPARLDDVLIIETRIDYVKKASICFEYSIWDEQLLTKYAQGFTVHACTTSSGKVTKLPAVFIEKIEKYFAGRKNERKK